MKFDVGEFYYNWLIVFTFDDNRTKITGALHVYIDACCKYMDHDTLNVYEYENCFELMYGEIKRISF
jgi:hypothetical protein